MPVRMVCDRGRRISEQSIEFLKRHPRREVYADRRDRDDTLTDQGVDIGI